MSENYLRLSETVKGEQECLYSLKERSFRGAPWGGSSGTGSEAVETSRPNFPL